MKKRYILLIVIVLFAASLWGLISSIEQNEAVPSTAPVSPLPEVPAAAPATAQ